VIYLPIFFICLVGGECDFVYAKPVPTQGICETMNAEYELRLESRQGDRGVQVDLRSSEQGSRTTDLAIKCVFTLFWRL
jgi:hypothetical protein